MFNLFKKGFPKETKEFAATFTKEQKAAIIGSHIIVAKEKNSFRPGEEKYIENVANLLHISLSDDAISASAYNTLNYMLQQLKSLTWSQKEWLAVSLNGLSECTGNMSMYVSTNALELLEKTGIDDRSFFEIIKKANSLKRKFM